MFDGTRRQETGGTAGQAAAGSYDVPLWKQTVCRARRRLAKLSDRETDVLQLVVSGQTNKSIAISLQISIKTVEKHRCRLMRKVNCRSLPDLMQLWFQAHPELLHISPLH
ncbi:MAG: hypothetical protein KDA89_02095 [Planctomycetaceae bacterium]|nr:hypothetical protein [Planctomycetaceae bacterium]